jgi:hypothetical protein
LLIHDQRVIDAIVSQHGWVIKAIVKCLFRGFQLFLFLANIAPIENHEFRWFARPEQPGHESDGFFFVRTAI